MLHSPPRVTVLMPVYNSENTLEDAITSVLSQAFDDFELLVVDDGSTDKTPEILARQDDPRIRVIRLDKNRGVCHARNRALQEARGCYIAHADSDDLMVPHRLERQVAYLDSHPDVALVGAWQKVFETEPEDNRLETRPTKPEALRFAMVMKNMVFGSVACYRRELALRAGGFGLGREVAEDYVLWSKFNRLGLIVNLPEPLVYYRLHPRGLTRADLVRMYDQLLMVSRQNMAALAGEPVSLYQAAFIREQGNVAMPKREAISAMGVMIRLYDRFLQTAPVGMAMRLKLVLMLGYTLANMGVTLCVQQFLGVQKTTGLKIWIGNLIRR